MTKTNEALAAVPAVEAPGLLRGYDDERSIWYVEPDLRDAYARIADDDVQPDIDFEQRINAGADRIARFEGATDRRERVGHIRREQLALAIAVDTHDRKVIGARLVQENDQRRADAAVLAEQLGTCPVCGEYDAGNGVLRVRNVFGDSHFSLSTRAGDIRSCGRCYLVAVDAARASATTTGRLSAVTGLSI